MKKKLDFLLFPTHVHTNAFQSYECQLNRMNFFCYILNTLLPVVVIFDFQFRLTAATPSKITTSIPDEYSNCCISTTINPKDCFLFTVTLFRIITDSGHVTLQRSLSEFPVLAKRERAFCELVVRPIQNSIVLVLRVTTTVAFDAEIRSKRWKGSNYNKAPNSII